jgi:N6-adenosine-specific RNA methylase IME4
MGAEVDLRCQDVRAMIASLPDGCAALVLADPNWLYTGGTADPHRGLAGHHYQGSTEAEIATILASTYRLAQSDSYLAVWCTFPKLLEWARHDAILLNAGWAYVTGAAWGKTNGLGVGYHFRGDAELLLLYKKGTPKPLTGSKSNLWLADRLGHSEKPQVALGALISMAAPLGGLVVDCYAGESASLARACRALGRRYVGAELDPARHARALVRLSQQEMLLEATA